MSRTVSDPARNSLQESLLPTSLEFVRLTPKWQAALECFFQDLKAGDDDVFFSPHPTDSGTLSRIAAYEGNDLYYLLVERGKVLGYGMLRGWDEGYQIPSLGLAIHSSARGQGLGLLLMNLLHMLAFRKGANKVRLRVRVDNQKALGLYRMLGYAFEENINKSDFLVGFKTIRRE
jgi:ribosomal protein S18 acetylase RimI-like enzyme